MRNHRPPAACSQRDAFIQVLTCLRSVLGLRPFGTRIIIASSPDRNATGSFAALTMLLISFNHLSRSWRSANSLIAMSDGAMCNFMLRRVGHVYSRVSPCHSRRSKAASVCCTRQVTASESSRPPPSKVAA